MPADRRLKGYKRLQWQLRVFFRKVWVELTVGVLVLISVALTLAELMLLAGGHTNLALLMAEISNLITLLFIVELSLRFISFNSKRQFFAEYWLDILAVLPAFRVFRSLRAIRLLRLFRVLRLIGVISRIASHFPYVFRRGIVEYMVVIGLLIVTVVFGTVSMVYFETPSSGQDTEFTLENSLWYSIYSLFAGEPTPITPETRGGKVITVFVMFMGVTIFAMFTGTVSAFMVERFRMENRELEVADMEDHVIICGWNSKTEIIIREYHASSRNRLIKIVVITEMEIEPSSIPEDIRRSAVFIQDDFTRIVALERANVHHARACIILSDTAGGRSEQDADARTILAALTVEKINPQVYTCAELLNRSYGSHLEMGHVNDYVVSGEYSAYMLAQASLNRGLMGVLSELVTYQRGQAFQRIAIPADWHGSDYLDRMIELKKKHNATLVAVKPRGKETMVNPDRHIFQTGDEVVVICKGAIKV